MRFGHYQTRAWTRNVRTIRFGFTRWDGRRIVGVYVRIRSHVWWVD